jgi:hypothetical protein
MLSMKNLLKCVPIVLALAACQSDELEDHLVTTPPDLETIATWNSTLSAIGPRPQASGTLRLDETGSYMLLNLTAQGLHADSSYHWRLFFGPCDARTARYGANADPPAYRIFRADGNGAGTSEATVSGRLKADSTYSLRVFIPRTSPTDTTWYACGNLQRQ